MKILILGGDGMLGHQLYKHFLDIADVYVTLRHSFPEYKMYNLYSRNQCFCEIDVSDFDRVRRLIIDLSPDIIINAVGIIKQKVHKNIEDQIIVNALLPHKLNHFAKETGARVINFSTDCVFDGVKGTYLEEDESTAQDVYGKTKYLGEISSSPGFTIRSSIIGFELKYKKSLLEWFLVQQRDIEGYNQAIFSGLTTIEMARVVEKIIFHKPAQYGVFQVASEPISKYDLLSLINKKFNLGLSIKPNSSFHCDRSLVADRFNDTFKYQPPSWESMVDELASIYRSLHSSVREENVF